MTDHTDKLEPCPLCNSTDITFKRGNRRVSTKYRCENCGCSLEAGEAWQAPAQWNTRPALSAPSPDTDVEGLVERLTELCHSGDGAPDDLGGEIMTMTLRNPDGPEILEQVKEFVATLTTQRDAIRAEAFEEAAKVAYNCREDNLKSAKQFPFESDHAEKYRARSIEADLIGDLLSGLARTSPAATNAPGNGFS